MNIAYSISIYDELLAKLLNTSFYPWTNEKNKERDAYLLLLYKQNIYSMISVLSLVLQGFRFQSMQLLRGYIESTVMIYLTLIDEKFFDKTKSSNLSEKEYLNNWFSSLKPSLIKREIYRAHKKHNDENDRKGIQDFSLFSIIKNMLTEGLIEDVYDMTSNFIHFKDSALYTEVSVVNDKSYVRLDRDNSAINILENLKLLSRLFPWTSSFLGMAFDAHMKIIEFGKIAFDFSELNLSLSQSHI